MTTKQLQAVKELTDFIATWSDKHDLLVHDACIVQWVAGDSDGLPVVANLTWSPDDGYSVDTAS